MKNLLLTTVLLMTTTLAFSQMFIQREVDEMDGKVSYSYSEYIYEKEDEKEAMVLLAIREDLRPYTLAVAARGIENCIENGKLIILFKDGDRLTATSYRDFNCDGSSWFSITKAMASQLASKEVDKIRITNGRSHESFTLEISNPKYYIEAYALSDAGITR